MASRGQHRCGLPRSGDPPRQLDKARAPGCWRPAADYRKASDDGLPLDAGSASAWSALPSTGRVLIRRQAQQPLSIAGAAGVAPQRPQVATEGRVVHQRRSQRVDKQRQTPAVGDRIQVPGQRVFGDHSRCSQPAGDHCRTRSGRARARVLGRQTKWRRSHHPRSPEGPPGRRWRHPSPRGYRPRHHPSTVGWAGLTCRSLDDQSAARG